MRPLRAIVILFATIALTAASWSWCFSQTERKAGKQKRTVVWMVFFSSSDCPKCESAKLLIEAMKSKYVIRVKTFDVERDKDYALFRDLQAIHSPEGFSVPLILLGNTILAGEEEINAKLDATIRGLAKSGGATLPYLGPGRAPTASVTREKRDCERNPHAQPPPASDEWRKIRSFLDYFF